SSGKHRCGAAGSDWGRSKRAAWQRAGGGLPRSAPRDGTLTMPSTINIGVDFGSLGWRAAFSDSEGVTALQVPAEWSDAAKWLLCEHTGGSIDGVRFPAIKDRL